MHISENYSIFKKPQYLQESVDYEIDFVTGSEGHFNLYQVCADLSTENTKKRARSVQAKKSAMN